MNISTRNINEYINQKYQQIYQLEISTNISTRNINKYINQKYQQLYQPDLSMNIYVTANMDNQLV